MNCIGITTKEVADLNVIISTKYTAVHIQRRNKDVLYIVYHSHGIFHSKMCHTDTREKQNGKHLGYGGGTGKLYLLE